MGHAPAPFTMRTRSLTSLTSLTLGLVLALPSVAAANPITAGVNLGVTQSKEDGAAGLDANDTIGLFGRIGFNKRISGQLEVTRIKTDDGSDVSIRSGTASLVIDLTSKGRLVPTLSAGIGLDSASTTYGSTTDAHHIEGGLGLEYRAEGGLTIGVDLRLGGRTLDQQQDIAYPATGVAYFAPSTLREGEYRSARLFLGVRF